MANPQKENGYTAIANEIMDVLTRTNLQSSERRVLDVIFRKTYGFNKKDDNISLSQIVEATALSRRTAIYATQNLEAKKMVIIVRDGYDSNKYCFQKNYDLWEVQRNSGQYENMLVQKRIKYKTEVVQRKTDLVQRNTVGSAEKTVEVVQRRDEKGRFSAHTKAINNKTIQKQLRGPVVRTVKKSRKDLLVDPTPMNLEQFLVWMRKPPRGKERPARHVEVIAEWAEAEKPNYTTKGQWTGFIRRNGRAASELVGYTNDQLQEAYDKLQGDIKRTDEKTGKTIGFITKYTLETLGKYL